MQAENEGGGGRHGGREEREGELTSNPHRVEAGGGVGAGDNNPSPDRDRYRGADTVKPTADLPTMAGVPTVPYGWPAAPLDTKSSIRSASSFWTNNYVLKSGGLNRGWKTEAPTARERRAARMHGAHPPAAPADTQPGTSASTAVATRESLAQQRSGDPLVFLFLWFGGLRHDGAAARA